MHSELHGELIHASLRCTSPLLLVLLSALTADAQAAQPALLSSTPARPPFAASAVLPAVAPACVALRTTQTSYRVAQTLYPLAQTLYPLALLNAFQKGCSIIPF